jgi:hypothetical protein
MAKEQRDKFGLDPSKDAATPMEMENASSGSASSAGSNELDRSGGRQVSDPVNFNRGIFAVMMTLKPQAKEFCTHPDCVSLRKEGMGLLGIPEQLANTFNERKSTDRMFSLLKATQDRNKGVDKRVFEPKKDTQGRIEPGSAWQSDDEYSHDRVQGLMNLARDREQSGHHDH